MIRISMKLEMRAEGPRIVPIRCLLFQPAEALEQNAGTLSTPNVGDC